MSNEQPDQPSQSPASSRDPLPWDVGVRPTRAQLGLLNIGQVEQILSASPLETHRSFLTLFAPLSQLAGAEAAQAYSVLAVNFRSNVEEEGTCDWNLFFSALKREELTEPITGETSLEHLSELLWERHTAP